jgi:3-methyladenine DNA glycosylase AlkD
MIDIFEAFKKEANLDKAKQMSAYMQNKFPFLGIQAPVRKSLSTTYFKTLNETKVDFNFINQCWDLDEREYQYLAIDYLRKFEKYLKEEDLLNIKILITTKSWWDSVDSLTRVVGDLALKYPILNETLLEWSLDDNMWLRRMAIIHQLLRKKKTDTLLLEKIIVNNLNNTQFFINKAIGWALRDYSKTDAQWVRNFIDKYKNGLSSLSIREGSKYI